VWPVINTVTGNALFRTFTLKAAGEKIEIWLDNNLSYPAAADCRNDGLRNVVTQAQIDYFVGEFDANMYPKESQVFSLPPSRGGANASLYTLLPVTFPKGYFSGAGDKIVTLVTNIRDESFSDVTFPSYVAGYHSSGINTFVDRNVMTIDSFDWVHRTGANPPNEPSAELCKNMPAKPHTYEGTFAHEYQHLLEFWASPGEKTWANEGLSDYAVSVVGYANLDRSVAEVGYEGHTQTFLGWRSLQTGANPIPQALGGAENSLTSWQDQGPLEILADYGAVWSFMEFLAGRYGVGFMTALHNEDRNGLDGVQAVLDRFMTGKTAQQIVHAWAAAVAVDQSSDDGAKVRGGADEADYAIPSMHASINLANAQSYDTPGAPPNGSDYVLLRDAAGTPLHAAQVKSLEFAGAKVHDLLPVTFTSVTSAPGHEGNAAYFSPQANNLDRSMIADVTVPTPAPTLTFDAKWDLEDQWDYAFVQASTDGGTTWKSLANADTTTSHDPGARATIVAQLPGFTGAGGWKSETFDLTPYAGRRILLQFRNMTDGASTGSGWWFDDIRVGGAAIGDGASFTGWRPELAAPAVAGFTVQLVGITGARSSIVAQVPLDADFRASLEGGKLRRLVGDQVDQVVAVVTYDEPTETITRYAPYTLTVNGVRQPGGH
jgi:hypothetical protein